MLEVVLSGLVTGWAIAIPIDAVGAFLVTLTARTRCGSAARPPSASRRSTVVMGLLAVRTVWS